MPLAVVRRRVVVALVAVALAATGDTGAGAGAQGARPVDFVRDVQPILRQRCIGCHGPGQQMAGLRLDRRRDALRGSTFGTVIGPGNAAASRLVLRVSGTSRGPQMPPTGALPPEEVAILTAWVDQGADWPDAAAGDQPHLPADPGASRLMALLRAGDRAGVRRALAATPAAAARQGADGITPLMYAALYAGVDEMRALIEAGADPGARNAAGATALFWAVDDPAKTRLLLDRGADVHLTSLDGRTPLMVAAARAGASPVLTMLLDKGADPNVEFAGTTALTEAAYAADVDAMRLLVARGADPRRGGVATAINAAAADCRACLALVLPALDAAALRQAAFGVLPPNDDGDELALFLDRGVDASAAGGRRGRPMLVAAAASDTMPVEVVRRLLAGGADVHASSPEGESALGVAELRGPTPVVDALVAAGAARAGTMQRAGMSPIAVAPAASPREAVARALPLLQQTGVAFRRKAGCVSCHNNTLTARVTAEARRAGVALDETVARSEVAGIAGFVESWRERALQGLGIPGDADTVSYILLGLADEGHPADAGTDALARFLKHRQLADGSWRTVAHRPPIESSDITVTALSMRALQVYAPAPLKSRYDHAVASAGRWLASRAPVSTEERAMQLLGLYWAAPAAVRAPRLRGRVSPDPVIRDAARALVGAQRADGGWGQLPTLDSDAYATGQALVALHDGGGLPTTDEVYRRGVAYLLRTQRADGTWYVRSRAFAIQPLFDIGFPHGARDSWISAAATNWAAIALSLAAQGR